jgi:molybdopterin-guanine dinucleotide biosynthesis protein A
VTIAGLLLTGGASRRMGRNKAGLRVGAGPTLAQRTGSVLAAVAKPAVELGPGQSGLEHLPDGPVPGGPLVAIAGGVAFLRDRGFTGPALVVATDLPLLAAELLAWLAGHPFPGTVVPVVGDRPQWLCARYGSEALDAAAHLVAQGHRAVRALGGTAAVHLAPPSEWSAAVGVGEWVLTDADEPADAARLGLR